MVISLAAKRLRDNIEEYAGYVTLEMGKLIAEARAEVVDTALRAARFRAPLLHDGSA